MANITIFGQGTMGKAIASIFTDGGNTVNFVGKETDAELSDIVVLATPYAAAESIIANYKDALKGKILVDISNPVDFSTMDSQVTPADSSAAEEIQKLVPDTTVVKAFNTTFAATLASKKVADSATTTVQIASDDEAAKTRLAELIQAGGLKTIDAGALKRSRELEAFGFLQITLAIREQITWMGGFAAL
ncbi:NADPH-dependent F420 reductase [Alloscardovia macacae]|uniref:Diguanylate cyclase n=1 Tax=Alloscardovia macacae TaxID=1160091 RepID=A0A1Y2SVD1_9BIFI|nr:NADPH-dependent F420 reductase [Alloscardovia macacae]OTA27209.1 diguanylate cyclase [Alloscardovia macacae]OTA28458.1 diguanylate cyclase [Alloscardovia macacae]OZG54190.1 diguanylate cyclase [Alloscardovia macacae]